MSIARVTPFAPAFPPGYKGAGRLILRQRPLSSTIQVVLPPRQDGFGLLGILLVTALGAVVMATAYTVYEHNHRSSMVAEAAASATIIGQRVRTTYAAQSDFSALNTISAQRDHVYPASTLNSSGQPINPWGGSIQLAGIPKGFVVTYEKVDPAACPSFAIAAATGWQDIKINGLSAMSESVVPVDSAAKMCARSLSAGATVQFVGTRNAGMVVAALTACVPQPPQYQAAMCPPGQISSVPPYSVNGVTQERTSFCSTAYGPVSWTPWAPVASTCAPICKAPQDKTDTQPATGSCPINQVTASGSSTFPQVQTQSITYSCPAPTGAYVTTTGPWSAPSPDASSVCATKCSAPPPSSKTVSKTTSCPIGKVTSSGSASFAQSQTVTTTYSCPALTGAYTSSSNATAWLPAAAAVCAPPPPPPVCGPAPEPVITTSTTCPAGQSGVISSSQGWVSAPAPTCWAPGSVTVISNTCTPSSPPPPPPPSAPSDWQCRDALAPTGTNWTNHGPNSACGDTSSATNCIALNAPSGNSIYLHRYNPGKGFDTWLCGCVGDQSGSGSSAIFLGRVDGPGNGVPAGSTASYWKCP